MFFSTYLYSVDDKGRLSVPSRFRDFLRKASLSETFFLTKGPNGCIWGYPEDRMNEITSKLADQPTGGMEEEFLRLFAADAVECPIDKQCRIIVPPALRDYAGVRRDVAVLGVVKRIEIWDRAKYEAYRKANASASVPKGYLL